MLIFSNDEEGYSEWMRENPQGFVLNRGMIHRASCLHLGERKDETPRTAFEKKVSKDMVDLITHVVAQGETLHFCGTCSPQEISN